MDLKAALMQMGWTQKALAEITGIREAEISTAVNGWPVSLEKAERIATAVKHRTDLHELIHADDAARLSGWLKRQMKGGGK